jgi:hypothetical protein
MAKPTLTGQSKRITRNAQGVLDSISLIPEVVPPVYPEHPTYPAIHASTTLPLTVDGWTDWDALINSYTDCRIVYVSPTGTAQGAVYSPDSGALGGSPTNPTGAIAAFQTLAQAKVHMRHGQSDVLLFERGQSFDLGQEELQFGQWYGGSSAYNRKIVGSYGLPSAQRPVIINARTDRVLAYLWGSQGNSHRAYFGLDFSTRLQSFDLLNNVMNILLEDCNFMLVGRAQIGAGVTLRRCTVSGIFAAGGHNQGIYADNAGALVMEECAFDKCGNKEDPWNPSTWTAPRQSRLTVGELAAGTGVQPTRTYFDRNIYINGYQSLDLSGCILSRGGGGGAVQVRTGGTIRENAFLFNHTALVVGSNQAIRTQLINANVVRNLILHDDVFLPAGGSGGGVMIAVGNEETGIVEDNIIAHFVNRANQSDPMLKGFAMAAEAGYPNEDSFRIEYRNNVCISQNGETMRIDGPDGTVGVENAVFSGNSISRASGAAAAIVNSSNANWIDIGDSPATANKYHAPGWSGFAAWQAAGYDTNSATYATLADLAAASGWLTSEQLADPQGRNGWERDIVSYMQFIDPEYVVNEDVTTDDGVPLANRRVSPQKVWEVLAASPVVMSEASAKEAARRYHAFLVFIERAKANRYGSWDWDYTAYALNNYIRAGFGKTAI